MRFVRLSLRECREALHSEAGARLSRWGAERRELARVPFLLRRRAGFLFAWVSSGKRVSARPLGSGVLLNRKDAMSTVRVYARNVNVGLMGAASARGHALLFAKVG